MKPKSSTNYKKIVDAVLDQINHGQLQKGDKLPTELSLATKFDVSRTCVREAIKSLEAMGIVQSIQGSGSYITNTPELSINRPICALFALSNSTLENVLDLRIVLETDVCRDIIRSATDDEIERLCALADYDYIGTPIDRQSVLDSQFHNSLMRMSHNALIKYIYTTLSSLMDIYRARVLEETWRLDENALTRAGHQAICQALRDRDEAAVAAAIYDHLTLTGPYRECLIEQDAEDEKARRSQEPGRDRLPEDRRRADRRGRVRLDGEQRPGMVRHVLLPGDHRRAGRHALGRR